MNRKIPKRFQGFVPAFIAHPRSLCAYYHCESARVEGRYCEAHADLYAKEVAESEGGKVLEFVGASPTI